MMERFFRDLKTGYRRKSGHNGMGRTFQAMLADTPLVKYLENLRHLPDEADPKYGTARNRIYFWAVCQGAQNFRAHLRRTMRAA